MPGENDDLELDPPTDGDEPVGDDLPEGDEPAEGDEPEGDEPEGDEPAGGEPTGRQASGEGRNDRTERVAGRASDRIRAQQDQIATLNRRIDDLLASGVANRNQPAPQGETPAQREQRLALLDPVDRMREEMQEGREASSRQINSIAFQLQDQTDRSAFEAKALVEPLYQKWAPKVEAELATLRSKGQNISRENLFYYMVGKHGIENRKKAAGTQRRDGANRLARGSAPAGNSRGDVGSQRRQGNSLEKRLEGRQL